MQEFSRYLNIKNAFKPVPMADAKSVAYLSDITGSFQVWKVGLKELSTTDRIPCQLTFFTNKIWEIHGSRVDPQLIAVGDVDGNERQQFYLVSQYWDDGHEVRRLTTNDDAIHRFGMWSKDGKRIFYTSNARNQVDFDIYELEIATGEEKLLRECSGNRTLVGCSPDESYLLMSESVSSLQNELYQISLKYDDKERHLTADLPPARYKHMSWHDYGIYMITDLYDDCGAVSVLQPWNCEVKTLVDSTLHEEPGELDCLAISPNSRLAGFTYNADGYSHLYMLDLYREREYREKDPILFTNTMWGNFSNLQFSRDSWTLYFDHQNFAQNANIMSVVQNKPTDMMGLSIHTLSDTAGVRTRSFVKPETIRYKSFDDLEIPAFYFQPNNDPPPGGHPCILYVHGGPASQLRSEFDVRFQYFLSQGYAILATNVRGSTGYGRTYTALDELELRMDSVADLKYAAHWLQEQAEIDSQRIAIYGRSYGGFMVLAAMTEYPELFAAGIDVVGIANWVTFMERTSPWRRAHREQEYGSLENHRDLLERISPIHKIERIQAPLMVVAGDNDPRVPLYESEQVAEKVRAAGGIVEFIHYVDEGHRISKLKNRIDSFTKMEAFLKQYV